MISKRFIQNINKLIEQSLKNHQSDAELFNNFGQLEPFDFDLFVPSTNSNFELGHFKIFVFHNDFNQILAHENEQKDYIEHTSIKLDNLEVQLTLGILAFYASAFPDGYSLSQLSNANLREISNFYQDSNSKTPVWPHDQETTNCFLSCKTNLLASLLATKLRQVFTTNEDLDKFTLTSGQCLYSMAKSFKGLLELVNISLLPYCEISLHNINKEEVELELGLTFDINEKIKQDLFKQIAIVLDEYLSRLNPQYLYKIG